MILLVAAVFILLVAASLLLVTAAPSLLLMCGALCGATGGGEVPHRAPPDLGGHVRYLNEKKGVVVATRGWPLKYVAALSMLLPDKEFVMVGGPSVYLPYDVERVSSSNAPPRGAIDFPRDFPRDEGGGGGVTVHKKVIADLAVLLRLGDTVLRNPSVPFR